MFTKPRITVILATYNRAHSVGRAITSVLNQAFKDFELIIVDGSSDNTKAVVSKFKDKRIIYLKKTGGGLASARNLGLKYAKGKYIAYIDDDDVYLPDHLRELSNFLDTHPQIGLVYSKYFLICPKNFNYKAPVQDFNKWALETACLFVPSVTMHRKICIEKTGPFNERMLRSEDWDMWLRISDCCNIKCLNKFTVKKTFKLLYMQKSEKAKELHARNKFMLDVIKSRTEKAKHDKTLLEYIDICAVRIVKELARRDIAYASILANNFHSVVKNYQTVACLGLCSLAKGDFSKAAELFKESIKKLPKNFKKSDSLHRHNITLIKLSMGWAYYYLNEISDSEKACVEVLKIDNENVDAKIQLASCYIKRSSFKKAMNILKSKNDDLYLNIGVHDLRGYCYFKMKKYSAALREFKKTVVFGTDLAKYQYNLAMTYMALGKRAAARAILRQILSEPRHQQANKRLLRLKLRRKNIPLSPKVSVIMPTYNRADMLAKSIKSALRQSFKDFELLIINDGSSDNTKAVVSKFKDRRIIYLEKKNGGPASARNLGLEYAVGDYIAYLDDDDVYLPGHLKELSGFLDKHPKSDLVYSYYLYAHPNGTTCRGLNFRFDKRLLETRNIFLPSVSMHRRGCIEKVGLFDETLLRASDWDMGLRISDYCRINNISKLTVKRPFRMGIIDKKPSPNGFYDLETHSRCVVRIIKKRISRAGRYGELLKYIDACSISMIKYLSYLDLKKSGEITRAFYKLTKNYQSAACVGLCYLAKNQFIKALGFFEKAAKKLPRNWKNLDSLYKENMFHIKSGLGWTYYSLGKIASSERICRRLLNIKPRHPELNLLLANCYIKRGLFKKAMSILNKKTIKNDYANSSACNSRGYCYLKMGMHKLAISSFKEALAIYPENPLFCYNLAITYAIMGKYRLARQELESALTMAPNSKEIKTVLKKLPKLS